MLSLILLLLSPSAQAACPSPVGLTWIDEQLTAGEIAFVTDPATLVLTSDRLARSLHCVDEALDQRLVARLHRLNGLRHFVEDSESDATRDFASARHASPSTGVPTTLVPADHRVHQLFVQLSLADLPTEPVQPPTSGSLLLNSAPRQERPTTIPVLVQHLDDQGQPNLTVLLAPGEPLPNSLDLEVPAPQPAHRKRPGWWAVATGVIVGSGAGVMYYYADQAGQDYAALDNATQHSPTGQALLDRNHGLLIGTGTAGVLSGVFTIGGLTWWRH